MSDYPGNRLPGNLPSCDLDNPADVESWWGNYGWGENWRKVILANAREIERARAAASDQKWSEAKIDDRARTSDTYVDFLLDALKGRQRREENLRQSIGA